MTPLNEPATPQRGSPSRRRAGWIATGVVFALTPWVTLGLGTPVAFIAAAVVFSSWRRAHATALWISAAVYIAVFVAFVASASATAGNPSGIFLAYVLILFVGGGVQALFTVWVAGTGQTGPARDLLRRRRAATAITVRPARPRDARPGRAAVVSAIEYHVTVRYQATGSEPRDIRVGRPESPAAHRDTASRLRPPGTRRRRHPRHSPRQAGRLQLLKSPPSCSSPAPT
jgi:hypothetical protein